MHLMVYGCGQVTNGYKVPLLPELK